MHHHNHPFKHIVILGNVGVGKSTLADLLEKALPAIQVPADNLFKTNPFFPLAVGDRTRWSLTSDMWFLYERVKLARSIPSLLEKSHVVVDSGLPMSYVYAHSRIGSGYFTQDEWKLYQSVYEELVTDDMKPDIVIYLKAPVELLRERIEVRGREFEIRFHSEEYLKSLENSIEQMVTYLQKQKVYLIDVDAVKSDFTVEHSRSLTSLITQIGAV